MEYTKDNFKRLTTTNLRQHDVVIFTVDDNKIKYVVNSDHLAEINGGDGAIFKVLDIENKHRYCSIYYDYQTSDGAWPVFKNGDFAAATELVYELFMECVKKFPPKPYTTTEAEPAKRKYPLYSIRDTVIFYLPDGKTVRYRVEKNHLSTGCGENYLLFTRLGLSQEQREKWAELSYGTHRSKGGWPYYEEDNMEQISKFIFEIKEIISDIEFDDDTAKYINVWKNIQDYYKGKTPTINKTSINVNQNQIENGKIIKIKRITPSVVRGERKRGSIIQGKNCRTSVTSGYIGYRTITG